MNIQAIEQIIGVDLSEHMLRAKKVKLVRDYYQGNHRDMLTENMRKRLRLNASQTITANWIPLIVHNEAARIMVLTITADNPMASEWATYILEHNNFMTLQNAVHTFAILDGDSFVRLSYDLERDLPILNFERAFDGEDGTFMIYNGEQPYVAVKIEKILVRMNGRGESAKRIDLFFTDRVERYLEHRGQIEPYTFEGPSTVPLPSIDGVPIGVPFAHFRNRRLGLYGKSEVEPVLGLQDMYNRTLASWLSAIEASGFPNRLAIGWNPSEIGALEPGDWIVAAPTGLDKDKIVEMKIIQPGDVLQLRDALKAIARIISNVTSTSAPEFFDSDSVSGDAQEARQTALLVKCYAFQREAHASWARVMDTAWALQSIYSRNKPPDTSRWVIEFSPIGIRKESEVVNSAVQAYSTGALSRRAFLEAVRSVFSWTPADIERILQERNQEAREDLEIGRKPHEFADMRTPSPKNIVE
jgi:hypothetical protein